jgi:hypothetical protein
MEFVASRMLAPVPTMTLSAGGNDAQPRPTWRSERPSIPSPLRLIAGPGDCPRTPAPDVKIGYEGFPVAS